MCPEVECLVMHRAPAEIREHRLCLRRHGCSFVVRACELPDAVEAVDPHKGRELGVVFSLEPVAMPPGHAEPGPAPGRVKGEIRGPSGPAERCLVQPLVSS